MSDIYSNLNTQIEQKFQTHITATLYRSNIQKQLHQLLHLLRRDKFRK